MAAKKNHPAITVCFILVVGMVNGQAIKSTAISDEPVHKGDTVVLQLGDYYGDIQWQKSINRADWQELPGR